jgi:6-phosphogluconolactonase
LRRVSSGGGSPAHLAVDQTDSFLYVSNYCSGSLAVIAVNPDGSLEQPCQIIEHKIPSTCDIDGSAHVHEVTFGSDGTILVNDLGLDQVFQYAVSASGLVVTPPVAITNSTTPGAGPRHTLIHPSGKFVFVINELTSTLSSYVYDSLSGALGEEVLVVSTLRAEESAEDMAGAEIQVSSNGRFLYVSNRDNSSPNLKRSSIAVFEVDDESGMLKLLQHADTLGEHPRHFNFFMNEAVLLVGNMKSNSIVTFMVDKETGLLTPASGSTSFVDTPSPTQIVKLN